MSLIKFHRHHFHRPLSLKLQCAKVIFKADFRHKSIKTILSIPPETASNKGVSFKKEKRVSKDVERLLSMGQNYKLILQNTTHCFSFHKTFLILVFGSTF